LPKPAATQTYMDHEGCEMRITKRQLKKIIREASGSSRSIWEIAEEIEQLWPNVNYAARPYLDAMHTLTSIDDMYMMDDADSVILYFLSNARSWRGPDAKRIKAELKKMSRY